MISKYSFFWFYLILRSQNFPPVLFCIFFIFLYFQVYCVNKYVTEGTWRCVHQQPYDLDVEFLFSILIICCVTILKINFSKRNYKRL